MFEKPENTVDVSKCQANLSSFAARVLLHKMRPYRMASYCALDSVVIVYAWVLITESGSVLAETMSG